MLLKDSRLFTVVEKYILSITFDQRENA